MTQCVSLCLAMRLFQLFFCDSSAKLLLCLSCEFSVFFTTSSLYFFVWLFSFSLWSLHFVCFKLSKCLFFFLFLSSSLTPSNPPSVILCALRMWNVCLKFPTSRSVCSPNIFWIFFDSLRVPSVSSVCLPILVYQPSCVSTSCVCRLVCAGMQEHIQCGSGHAHWLH